MLSCPPLSRVPPKMLRLYGLPLVSVKIEATVQPRTAVLTHRRSLCGIGDHTIVASTLCGKFSADSPLSYRTSNGSNCAFVLGVAPICPKSIAFDHVQLVRNSNPPRLRRRPPTTSALYV